MSSDKKSVTEDEESLSINQIVQKSNFRAAYKKKQPPTPSEAASSSVNTTEVPQNHVELVKRQLADVMNQQALVLQALKQHETSNFTPEKE